MKKDLEKWIVQIDFAHPNIAACEHLEDIRAAIKNAKRNLYGRHGVYIGNLRKVKNSSSVLIDLGIPFEKIRTFSLGRHLRGISDYLLKDPYYRDKRYGTRLLTYRKIDDQFCGQF